MPAIGLAEAARLTGRNVSTIHRAMKVGRLSYTKDSAVGGASSSPSMERVFGLKSVTVASLDSVNGAVASIDAKPMQSHSRGRGTARADR